MTIPREDQESPSGLRWTWQFSVAVGLLAAFAVLVVSMMLLAHGDEILWQRRVYLFGAVEAIVFTAIGWLFGKEVHRSAVQSAKNEAVRARQDAADAHDEASRMAGDVAEARALATAEKIKALAVKAVIDNSFATAPVESSGPRDVRQGPASTTHGMSVDLKALVDQLYGESS